MNNPLVSIIIPTYNRAHLIGETLDSIIVQTYTNWECIVVDDGSTDNTEEVVSAYVQKDSRFQFHHRPDIHKPGGNGARNYGFSLSKGEYINWFDSDDLMINDHLLLHINKLYNSTYDCSVSGGMTFIDYKENIIKKWSEISPKKNIIDEMISNKILWPINGVIWKKEKISNRFNEDLYCSQEWVFHLLQIISGIKYFLLSESTSMIRQHNNRIGKLVSENKNYSIFLSRKIIYNKLIENKINSKKGDFFLHKNIISSYRLSILNKYKNQEIIIKKFLFKSLFKSKNKLFIARVLFISAPIYKIFDRGEKLFK